MNQKILFKKIVNKEIVQKLFIKHSNYYKKNIYQQLLKQKFIDKRSVFLKNNFTYNKISSEKKKLLTGHFPLKFRLNIYKILLKEKTLINKLKKILKTDNFFIYIPTMSRFSLPRCKLSLTPWHNDSAYTPQFQKFFTVWIPLVNVKKNKGGICFLNKNISVKKIKSKKNIFFSSFKLNEKPNIKYFDCDVGDALIFNNKTIHKSLINTANNIRYSIDFRVSDKRAMKKHCYSIQKKKILLPDE